MEGLGPRAPHAYTFARKNGSGGISQCRGRGWESLQVQIQSQRRPRCGVYTDVWMYFIVALFGPPSLLHCYIQWTWLDDGRLSLGSDRA